MTKILTGAESIHAASVALAKAYREHRETVKENITTVFQTFLQESGFHRVQWAQYAPHFNDGDPCVFSTRDAEFYLPPGDERINYEPDDEDDPFCYTWGDNGYYSDDENDPLMQYIQQFQAFMSQIGDDILEELYGNGYLVIITSEGIDTEDYDHD